MVSKFIIQRVIIDCLQLVSSQQFYRCALCRKMLFGPQMQIQLSLEVHDVRPDKQSKLVTFMYVMYLLQVVISETMTREVKPYLNELNRL